MIDPQLATVFDYVIIGSIFTVFAAVAVMGIREFSRKLKEDSE